MDHFYQYKFLWVSNFLFMQRNTHITLQLHIIISTAVKTEVEANCRLTTQQTMMGDNSNEVGRLVQTLVRMRSGEAARGISTVSAVQTFHCSSAPRLGKPSLPDLRTHRRCCCIE